MADVDANENMDIRSDNDDGSDDDETEENRPWNNFFLQNYLAFPANSSTNSAHHKLETSGNVILPSSALLQISRKSDTLLRPMMFKARKLGSEKSTHCGVLEFSADDHACIMPSWMMKLLNVDERDVVSFELAQLPIATFAKFQPQSADFLQITDCASVLENTLRHFTCLTIGDLITIQYNNKLYELLVLQLTPAEAGCILNCDLNVDFALPVGYIPPPTTNKGTDDKENKEEHVPFLGTGRRLDGVPVKRKTSEEYGVIPQRDMAMADLDWKIGTVEFKRQHSKPSKSTDPEPPPEKKFVPFDGVGMTLEQDPNTHRE